MKTAVILFAFSLLGGVVCYQSYGLRKDVERLAAENTELRLRDANRARLKALRKGRVDVNAVAISKAAYDMGALESLLKAAAKQEAGGAVYEMGHGGKTAFIWATVAPDEAQYYEAARSFNRALWAWAWADPKRRKEVIKALGKAYTHPAHAKTWARNVEKLEKGTSHAGND